MRTAAISLLAVVAAAAAGCEVPNPAYQLGSASDREGQGGLGGVLAGHGGLGAEGSEGFMNVTPMTTDESDRDGGMTWQTAQVGRDASSQDTAPPPAITLSMGLVGFWTLDEATGTTVRDRSGHGNHGTLSAKIIPDQAWVAGVRGNGLSFPDDHEGVMVPPSPSIDGITRAYTLAGWVWRRGAARAMASVISRGVEGEYWEHYNLMLDAGRPTLCVSQAGTSAQHLVSGATPPASTWFHAAATFDGKHMRVYLDGKLDKVEARVGPVTRDNSALYIGTNKNYWRNQFGQSGIVWESMAGVLDEVALFDRALSEGEIAALALRQRPQALIP